MISNPKTLKDFILRTLGAPVVNVEVTEDQIYDCIQRTLDLFGEYHYDGTNKAYAVFKLSKAEADSGVLNLSGKNVFAVSKIIRTSTGMAMGFGGTPYNWFSDMVLSFSGGQAGGCGGFYSPLSPFSGGMSYFTQLSSYFTMLQDQFSPIPDYWFNEMNGQLQVTGKHNEGDIVVCEVYVKAFSSVNHMVGDTLGYGMIGCGSAGSFGESYMNPDLGISQGLIGQSSAQNSQGVYNQRWVKEYSTALVKHLNGYILSKHQGMQLPGGVTIDGLRMMDDAERDKERLYNELLMLDTPMPIIMG